MQSIVDYARNIEEMREETRKKNFVGGYDEEEEEEEYNYNVDSEYNYEESQNDFSFDDDDF